MTDSATASPPAPADDRPYSPGLEGVLAGETSLSKVDGANGRLIYRGYRIGDLVERGTYPAVANLLWTGEWDPAHRLATAAIPGPVMDILRALPTSTKPMDALRTAVSAWGATQDLPWPPTVEHARALTPFSPSALAAFVRFRAGEQPVDPDPSLDLVEGFLYQLTGEPPGRRHRASARRLLHRRRRARLQRLDVHRPGHHLDPLRHRLGSRRRDRDDEGSAPRRRALGGRRPAREGRLRGARRAVAERGAGPGRAADGLRSPRLPRLRPARRGAAQGRRGDGAQARLAGARDRRSRTSRCGSSPSGTRTGRSRPTSSTTRRRSSRASA